MAVTLTPVPAPERTNVLTPVANLCKLVSAGQAFVARIDFFNPGLAFRGYSFDCITALRLERPPPGRPSCFIRAEGTAIYR